MEFTSGEVTEIFYRSPHLPFTIENLVVTEFINGRMEPGMTLSNEMIIRGTAVLNQRSLSVMGRPEIKVHAASAILKVAQETLDPNKMPLAAPTDQFMLSNPIGAVYLGFNPSDWEAGSEDEWYLEIYIPENSFRSFLQRIIKGEIENIQGRASVWGLYSPDHWMDPEIGHRDLMLRPESAASDKRKSAISSGPLTSFSAQIVPKNADGKIAVARANAESNQLEGDDPAQPETITPNRTPLAFDASPLADQLGKLRSTIVWVGLGVAMAVLYSAHR